MSDLAYSVAVQRPRRNGAPSSLHRAGTRFLEDAERQAIMHVNDEVERLLRRMSFEDIARAATLAYQLFDVIEEGANAVGDDRTYEARSSWGGFIRRISEERLENALELSRELLKSDHPDIRIETARPLCHHSDYSLEASRLFWEELAPTVQRETDSWRDLAYCAFYEFLPSHDDRVSLGIMLERHPAQVPLYRELAKVANRTLPDK
jgi:hypothetical protein